MPGPTTKDVARRLAVSEGTLRRWVRTGIVPLPDGEWPAATIAHARIVAHLRERGHGVDEIRRAADSGRLVSGFQARRSARPLPRIGIHRGWVLHRDGDHFGRAVSLASRVSARTAGGEVPVTRPVVDGLGARRAFTRVGEVKLKSFDAPTELFGAEDGRV